MRVNCSDFARNNFKLFLFLAVYTIFEYFGWKAGVVYGQSMEPNFMIGNVVIIKSVDPSFLNMEDAIIFALEDFSLEIIIHRIVGISDGETGKRFKTKGDNNSNPEMILFGKRG